MASSFVKLIIVLIHIDNDIDDLTLILIMLFMAIIDFGIEMTVCFINVEHVNPQRY